MEQMKTGADSFIDLKYDRQDVIETRKYQIQFDKHLFSVRKTTAVERQHSYSTDAMQQQMNSKEHDANNTLLVDTTRKSWLNDYQIVSCLYPSYKNDLQEYLQRRTKDSTDNNCRRLCVMTDTCWEDFELLDKNLPLTYQTILNLLEVDTEHYKFHIEKQGRNIYISLSAINC